MTLQSQNLGLVKAIHVGASAPSNTNMLWRDTSVNPNVTKQYNNVDDVWEEFGGTPTPQVQADWNQSDNTEVDFIKNKPAGATHSHTRAEMLALQAANGFIPLDYYVITDVTSVGGTAPPILVQARTVNALYHYAIGMGYSTAPLSSRYSSIGYYNLTTDLFSPNGYEALTLTELQSLPNPISAEKIFQVSATSVNNLTYHIQGTFATCYRMAGFFDVPNDIFYPSGGVEFRLELTALQIKTAGFFDISELPAIAGYFWRYTEVDVKFTANTTPFNGGGRIITTVDGLTRGQFQDDGSILSTGADVFGSLIKQDFNTIQLLKLANAKGQVYIDAPSSVGDGTLIIYGSAKLVKL